MPTHLQHGNPIPDDGCLPNDHACPVVHENALAYSRRCKDRRTNKNERIAAAEEKAKTEPEA